MRAMFDGNFRFHITIQHPITNTKKPRQIQDIRREIMRWNFVILMVLTKMGVGDLDDYKEI